MQKTIYVNLPDAAVNLAYLDCSCQEAYLY